MHALAVHFGHIGVNTPNLNVMAIVLCLLLAIPVMWFINRIKGFLPTLLAGIGFVAVFYWLAHLHH